MYTAAVCFHTLLYIRKSVFARLGRFYLRYEEKKLKNEDKKLEYFVKFEIAGSLEMY